MRKEIRLSGSGGQGLILAGIILAEGAILSNLNSVQTQSYGPEARGGASKAEVIISDGEINFPKARKADLLLCLTQKAFEEYSNTVKKGGTIIIDSMVDQKGFKSDGVEIIKVPIIESSKTNLGKEMVANIVALGVIGELIDEIDNDMLKRAILGRVPKGTEKLNEQAFKLGHSLVNLAY
ncbi:2-oxoacid:acceptor oxidoreductase family protein [Paraclostridium sordellii]|uniref:2-oxoacid:acceptor oxidoreductase family protein n=1 Tax=Paraclostridium sordellii TaxID=1505 RepID=UPI000E4CBF72|nr:2-oxoacid:acceptor oxidoreductase family protein [Paeniclostridium sordellii]MCR1848343.1 2-oxoacid:acceptor oxidoreductase family protein [Paeniclostridium sordellii]RGX03765.1 2-oxoacid:ferredoxin oxidoreductase subunit gamma [Paeniclostridium sordellii]